MNESEILTIVERLQAGIVSCWAEIEQHDGQEWFAMRRSALEGEARGLDHAAGYLLDAITEMREKARHEYELEHGVMDF